MAGPLNRAPEGLLDLVGVKGVSQRYPSELIEAIAPVTDVTKLLTGFYAVNAVAGLQVIAATQGATVIDVSSAMWLSTGNVDLAEGGAVTAVPPGEMWIVDELNINWSVPSGAGSSASFWVSCRTPATAFFSMVEGPLIGFNDSVAGAVRGGARQSQRPFLMMPGDRMRVHHDGIVLAAGNCVWNLCARVRRLLR